MGVVYRYIDLNDNNIKYVGIVWSGNRTLKERVDEHYKNDSWCDRGHWRIEYVLRDVNTRTDAEYLEAHYTNKFRKQDSEWFGKTKLNWGESEIIDDSNDKWEIYYTDEESLSNLSVKTYVKNIKIFNSYLERAIGFEFDGFDNENYSLRLLTRIKGEEYKEHYIAGDELLYEILKTDPDYNKILEKHEDFVEGFENIMDEYYVNVEIVKSEIDGSIQDVCFLEKFHFTPNKDSRELEFIIDNEDIKNFIVEKEIKFLKQLI